MSTSVAVCIWGAVSGELGAEAQEALTLTRDLVAALGTDIKVVSVGAISEQAAADAISYGASAVDSIAIESATCQADVFVGALTAYFKANPATTIVFPQTFESRLVSARLAGRLGAGAVMNCVGFSVDEGAIDATVSAFGGDTRAVYRCANGGTYIFSINPNAVVPEPSNAGATAPSVNRVSVDVDGDGERITILERPEEAAGPRLEHAQVVVAGGRGLGEKENFQLVEDLAVALDGMAGASRPIVDDGWATPAQQVGLTGKITKPSLYIAAGISGASQHMVGCAAAKTLVAINQDPDAAIFRYAKYGIVGNCLEVLPELTAAAKKA
jgi:electron transfer flavoprotein alpha subunit